jgi:pyruvate formate-lyase activating enzyme-like uncharacterized protein
MIVVFEQGEQNHKNAARNKDLAQFQCSNRLKDRLDHWDRLTAFGVFEAPEVKHQQRQRPT